MDEISVDLVRGRKGKGEQEGERGRASSQKQSNLNWSVAQTPAHIKPANLQFGRSEK